MDFGLAAPRELDPDLEDFADVLDGPAHAARL